MILESEMNKYPYIGKFAGNCGTSIALFIGEGKACYLDGDFKTSEKNIFTSDYLECEFKNITAEYLANTRIKICSAEHESFIFELVDGTDLVCEVSGSYAFIYEDFILDAKKEIAIPLPPKESEAKITTEAVVAGDSKTYDVTPLNEWQDGEVKWRKVGYVEKEWPAVGDEALTSSKQKVSVLAIHGGEAWVKYDGTPIETGYASIRVATLSKPPTPEEELTQALKKYASSHEHICEWRHIATSIINGEIEGLEYKPQ